MASNRAWALGPIVALGAWIAWPAMGLDGGESPEHAVTERVAKLETVRPRLAEAMSLLGRQFGNLWFAIDKANWPLAEFYLQQCRDVLAHAVVIEPSRTLTSGSTLPLQGMAQKLDQGYFNDMRTAIAAKDRGDAGKAYRNSMKSCMSCHAMFDRPFLRLRIPEAPPTDVIEFEPPGGKMP